MPLCEGCKNPDAWVIHYKKESITGKVFEECNKCFDPSISRNPDVYFKEPYWDENISDFDDPSYDPRRGTFVTSRSHKAYLLKKCGLRENGDRRGGGNNFDPISHRHAMASLHRR